QSLANSFNTLITSVSSFKLTAFVCLSHVSKLGLLIFVSIFSKAACHNSSIFCTIKPSFHKLWMKYLLFKNKISTFFNDFNKERAHMYVRKKDLKINYLHNTHI